MIVSGKHVPPLLANGGFLVVEGVNGAGKTTVKSHIIATLKERGIDFIETFEPGDTPLGKSIRSLLLGKDRDIESSLAELFLFAADRAEHVARVIRPALQAGKIVICDRYYYSTTAFQGYGRGNNLKQIEEINKIAVNGVVPDLVLLLDIDAEIGLKRNLAQKVDGNTFTVDALENEDLEFHKRIRQGFLKIAEDSKEPFVVIDAAKELVEVISEIDNLLTRLLKR